VAANTVVAAPASTVLATRVSDVAPVYSPRPKMCSVWLASRCRKRSVEINLGMEWVATTTIPVLTFIAGLWWNRHDGDRREHRAARAAASAAFEHLQREAHLELQDQLGKMYLAAMRAGRVGKETGDLTAASPSSITVDAYALTFTDSSRPAALLRAGGSAHDVGVAFRISSPSPKRRRLVELTGTKDYLSPHE
jgi:hypothetical protein